MKRIMCYSIMFVFAAVIAGCGGGTGGDNPADGGKSVTVNPASAVVAPGAQKRFTVSVEGLSDDAVEWEVVDGIAGGEVNSDGLYTAPAAVGVYKVKATSKVDRTISGTAAVLVTVSCNYGEIDYITGSVNIRIDDSVSYDFTQAGSRLRSDFYLKQDITYRDFILHGPIGVADVKYYWNTHIGETMTVEGSLEKQEDCFSYAGGKIIQTDKRIAGNQSKTVETYFRVTVDPVSMTFEIDFDNVYLDGHKYWEDFESGDYEKGTETAEASYSCKATDIPLVISEEGYMKGTKSGIPVEVFLDSGLYVDATLTWDLKAVMK